MRYSIGCPDDCPGSHDVTHIYEKGVETGLTIARAAVVLEAYKPIPFPIGFGDDERRGWSAGRRTMLAQAEHAIDNAAESRLSTGNLDRPAG